MGWNDKQNLTALQNVTARHIPLAHILKTKFGLLIRVFLVHFDTIMKLIFVPHGLQQRNHHGGEP